MKALQNTITELKNENQDFEWYPTTKEILKTISKDIKTIGSNQFFSIMDIGAGNGNIFSVLEENDIKIKNKFAIEKSKILIDSMPKDVCVIGTNFFEQTFMDKKVDIIFCNPPYSEFVSWTVKIIKEVYCGKLYLVLPERWKNNEQIKKALENRKAKSNILGNFSFNNSEYRKANVNVDIISVDLGSFSSFSQNIEINRDPFSVWFDDHFQLKEPKEVPEQEKTAYTEKKIHEMVHGYNLIDRLTELYDRALKKLLKNYQSVCDLDPILLYELNVDIKTIKEGLELKIKNLKNVYWKELFDHLDTITLRLTSDSRKKFLDKLFSKTNVDFTADNIYAIVIWAINNANQYIDEQLINTYMDISDSKNVILYKSNNHIIEDGWRYNKREMSNYSLDYRIVVDRFKSLEYDYYGKLKGLTEGAFNLLNDIFTIAQNLGFEGIERLVPTGYDEYGTNKEWKSGKQIDFNYNNGLFASVRVYKNGNIHLKLNQEFMKKFNIEAARLNGWIKSPSEAANEINDIDIHDANTYFKTTNYLLTNSVPLLCEN